MGFAQGPAEAQPTASQGPGAASVSWPTAERPTEPYRYRVLFDRRVRMRDGVELSADVYLPEGDAGARYPALLRRTPYTKAAGGDISWLALATSRGYAVVLQDVRGRGDSDGSFNPWRQEGHDGYDSIEWVAAQDWCTGRVGTYGGSYEGYSQWLAAVEEPPHLTCMVATVSCPDPFVDGLQMGTTGTLPPVMVTWYHLTSGHLNQSADVIDWPKALRHEPLYTLDEAFGRSMPVWREMIDHPVMDSWWDAARYQNRLDRVRVPVLHVSGWYDDEHIATTTNFRRMVELGGGAGEVGERVRANQKLLMGPWPHAVNSGTRIGDIEFGPAAKIDLQAYSLRWFDRWLKDDLNGVEDEPAVRYFVMGGRGGEADPGAGWRDAESYPLPATAYVDYHLRSAGSANTLGGDGELTTQPPSGGEPSDDYVFDPADPAPFIMPPSFAQVGGPDDYRSVEARQDVLVFTSEAITQPLEVCGPVFAHLYVSSDAPDTDFLVRLLDVSPDGFAQRLCDGLVRLRYREGMDRVVAYTPDEVVHIEIDLWDTCQVFKPGHRIRVEVTSSGFPAYDVNPNTGEPVGKSVGGKKANQRVYHEPGRESRIVLPIVPAR